MNVQRMIVILGLFFCAVTLDAAEPQRHGPALVYSVKGNFNDVKSDIVDAITDRGMVISYVAHVQSMLDRTAKVVGIKESVYENGETILVCKSGLSHELAKENPHNIVLCPWGISVYTLKGKPDTVYVSTRLPFDTPSYKAIQSLLEDIIHDAVGN